MEPKNTEHYTHFMNRLADELVKGGHVKSAPVEAAFRKVPRHLFIDHGSTDLQEEQRRWDFDCDHKNPDPKMLDCIYRDLPVGIGFNSTSSQPMCMAWMLEDIGLKPGMKVLEIGAGSGYNAALMAEIVGDSSLIYTVEVTEELANSARTHLKEAGYGGVTVICGDGAEGYPAGAPYDAIIATCGARDLSPAWIEQLTENGVIFFPFRILSMGDPTLLARRSKTGFEGKLTRLIFFVPLESDLLACPVQPDGIDEAAAIALNEENVQILDSGALPGNFFSYRSDRERSFSFLLFRVNNLQEQEVLVIGQYGEPSGIANPSAKDACFNCVVDGKLKMKTVGGTKSFERIKELYQKWEELGSPRVQDYQVTILPINHPAAAPKNGFIITRKHHKFIFTV